MPVSQDHVGALNLVEIEFHAKLPVIAALRALIDHFESGYGANKTLDELKAANDRSDALRTKMLSEMAKTLGYKFEQMDIHRGGYTPIGWSNELDEQSRARKGLLELFYGSRALPVTIVQGPANAIAATSPPEHEASPFPPKPN